MGGDEFGLLFTSQDSLETVVRATNITLNELYQYSFKENSLIHFEGKNTAYITDLKVLNSGGQNTAFYYQKDGKCTLKNIYVENYKSKIARELINYESSDKPRSTDGFKLRNFISQGPIFKLKDGILSINDCDIKDIHLCNLYNNCDNSVRDPDLLKSELLLGYSYNVLNFDNSTLENIYGGVSTYIKYNNNLLKNSNFEKGFFYMDEFEHSSGGYYINESIFENITSEYGTIYNIGYINDLTGCQLNSTNSYYVGNRASKYGGVIYSMGPYNFKHVHFINDTFIDNHAELGDIIHTYSINTSPTFTNIEEIEAIEGAISTNPTSFILDEDSIKSISIYSGDSIPSNITCKL
ncbi:hypothetical protein PIROE2DRAFT_13890 [Piromyces sp. E2]|nr:hypothetical protein PIROE2DRAFT_13890 [Piromyces sp. E2]|eukprot:OUM60345.1 hypothetical protein PIROE2DRAFT_13890 [Piromyces sp. E2]